MSESETTSDLNWEVIREGEARADKELLSLWTISWHLVSNFSFFIYLFIFRRISPIDTDKDGKLDTTSQQCYISRLFLQF